MSNMELLNTASPLIPSNSGLNFWCDNPPFRNIGDQWLHLNSHYRRVVTDMHSRTCSSGKSNDISPQNFRDTIFDHISQTKLNYHFHFNFNWIEFHFLKISGIGTIWNHDDCRIMRIIFRRTHFKFMIQCIYSLLPLTGVHWVD